MKKKILATLNASPFLSHNTLMDIVLMDLPVKDEKEFDQKLNKLIQEHKIQTIAGKQCDYFITSSLANNKEWHRANLIKLMNYLVRFKETKNKKFSMQTWRLNKDKVLTRCVGGCTPEALNFPIPYDSYINWLTYLEAIYGFPTESKGWLFASCWIEIDNTAFGAAQRIYYYLNRGCSLPDTWDFDTGYYDYITKQDILKYIAENK